MRAKVGYVSRTTIVSLVDRHVKRQLRPIYEEPSFQAKYWHPMLD